jgi:hypothetical protein
VIDKWKKDVNEFIELTTKHGVKMLLVGGGAVNFHGYQRHSADVDFWIDTTDANFKKLLSVFKEMGYELNDFPEDVKNSVQNISVKFSPVDLDIELITRFSLKKTFEEAYASSETVEISNNKLAKINILKFSDLIESKIRAGRPKDLLDVQQLKEINGLE